MAQRHPITTDYDDAVAVVTGPNGSFTVETIELADGPWLAFADVPPNLLSLVEGVRGTDTFIAFGDERWTFDDVHGLAAGLAHTLRDEHGVRRGDRIVLASANTPEWVIAFTAIVAIGAIVVPVNTSWVTAEFEYVLDHCEPKIVIADQARTDRLGAACRQRTIPVLGIRGATGQGVTPLCQRLAAGYPAADVSPTDDAMILYTSGTSGRPKGAVSTHGAVLQAIRAFGCRSTIEEEIDRSDGVAGALCFILAVPLFHVTGCLAVMLAAFAGSGRLVMMGHWNPHDALKLIERERVTHFIGVPTQVRDLLRCDAFDDADTSSLVRVGGGGAPAAPDLVREVAQRIPTARPNIGYGMTETNGYGPINVGNPYLLRPDSCGRIVPILKIDIRDTNGVNVPTGTVGEIWFRGPHLVRGYWNAPDATAQTMVNGWLRSGDLGRVDPDGFYYVLDRAKDMILRGGENVYCAEVEAAIYAHSAVGEAAVFGIADERLGEQVAAVIVPRAGATVDVEDLVGFLKTQLANYKLPTTIHIRQDPLPRTGTGKILKRDLVDVTIAATSPNP